MSPKYIAAMCEFSKSQFEDVRMEFAQFVPTHHVTPEAVEALKGIIFAEAETLTLATAITKFMLIHGMDCDRKSSIYKSIYSSLKPDDPIEQNAE